jgi:hypothetical protein
MSLNDANKCLHEFLIEGLVVYGADSARGMIMAAHARMAHGSSIAVRHYGGISFFFFWKAMLPRQVRWVVPTAQTQYRQHLLVVTPPFRTTSLYPVVPATNIDYRDTRKAGPMDPIKKSCALSPSFFICLRVP